MSPIQENELKSSRFIAYTFFAFVSIAEGCLFPYLTLHFKHLGLSATQAGIIRAVQSFLSVWSIMLWVHCATRFHLHRCVVFVSLLLSVLAFMSIVVIPPLETSEYFSKCRYNDEGKVNTTGIGSTKELWTEVPNTLEEPNQGVMTESSLDLEKNDDLGNSYLFNPPVNKNWDKIRQPFKTHSHVGRFQNGIDNPPGENVPENRYFDESSYWKRNREEVNNNLYYDEEESVPRPSLKKSSIFKREIKFTKDNFRKCINCKRYKKIAKRQVSPNSNNEYEDNSQTEEEAKIEIDQNLTTNEIPSSYTPMYWFLLLAVVVGSLFGSPAVTTADQAWYEFLDDLDLTEKYGHHHVFCFFLSAVAALFTSIAVALTSCRLWTIGDHFNIHFFVYGFFLAIALLFSICFPVVSSKFSLAMPQTGRISECRLLYADHGLFLVTMTTLIIGALMACVQDFVLWTVEDAGGNEIQFGCIVAVGFIAEMFAPTISRFLLLKKFRLYPIIATSLIFFSLRLLSFSFMWSPWSALIGQFIHFGSACSTSAIISAYVNNTVDHNSCRAIRTTMVPSLLLMGRTMGSSLSGVAHDFFGPTIMFQCASGFAFIWSTVVFIVYRCTLDEAKPYVKLVHTQDNSDGGPGDSETDEDWLDDALKKPALATSA